MNSTRELEQRKIHLENKLNADGKLDRECYNALRTVKREHRLHLERCAEFAELLSNLASVDGRVLLSDHLEVFGFGAVVDDASPAPVQIKACSDARCENWEWRRADEYGTRHQSAFRFCMGVRDAIAFVLSQDGGVKAMKEAGGDLVMFDEVALEPQAWLITDEDIVEEIGTGRLLPT